MAKRGRDSEEEQKLKRMRKDQRDLEAVHTSLLLRLIKGIRAVMSRYQLRENDLMALHQWCHRTGLGICSERPEEILEKWVKRELGSDLKDLERYAEDSSGGLRKKARSLGADLCDILRSLPDPQWQLTQEAVKARDAWEAEEAFKGRGFAFTFADE